MSLKKDASIYLATNIVHKTIPFLLLPLLTRYLNPKQLGMVEMFVLSAAFMDMLICFNVDSAIGRGYFEFSARDRLADYNGTGFILVSVSFVFISLLCIAFQKPLSSLTELPVGWLVLAGTFAFAKCITLTNLILWRMEKKAATYGLYLIPYALLDMLLSVVLVVVIRNWPGRVLGMVVAAVVFALISIWILQKRGYLKMAWERAYAKSILRYCMPLLPHNLSSWVKGSLDLFVIGLFIGVEGVGIYAVAVTIAKGILLIVESFAQTWMPHVYAILTVGGKGKSRLVQQSYMYMLGLLGLAVVYVLLVPIFFPWVIGDRFVGALQFVPLLVVAHVFDGWYRIFVIYIFYSKRTEIVSVLSTVTGVIHAILLFILVKPYGLMGAAISILCSSLIMFLSVIWISNKVYPMPWRLLWTYERPTK